MPCYVLRVPVSDRILTNVSDGAEAVAHLWATENRRLPRPKGESLVKGNLL